MFGYTIVFGCQNVGGFAVKMATATRTSAVRTPAAGTKLEFGGAASNAFGRCPSVESHVPRFEPAQLEASIITRLMTIIMGRVAALILG